MQVPFYRHGLDGSYAERVAAVLDSPFLTSGSVGKEVESELSSYFGVPHAKLTNSWTNGAVAALLALGIGPGDEVIVPAQTFIATANVVELVGATPVFADVEPDTQLLSPEAVASKLGSRTRAVIPVHLYGQLADVAGIRAVVGSGVAIVEDAAHAFEATLNGERPGTHGDCAIFSFYATKNVTCGEGGAVITRSAGLHEAVLQTVLHGMSAGAADRFSGGSYRHWDMLRLGTKANLPDLLAALLPPQLRQVEARREERVRLHDRYVAGLAELDGVRVPRLLDGARSAHHLFPIHVGSARRDGVLAGLGTHRIGATVNYNPVLLTSYYQARYGLPGSAHPAATDWGLGTLSLPLFPGLREDEQDYVLSTLRTLLETDRG